ncbi:E3 ubiquitin-protein ligase rad18 [Dispira simplex]|nr:E3 ubiquitin-protein ligase rad18 [Dispira simplex]
MESGAEYRYLAEEKIDVELYCSICHDVFVDVRKTRRCKHLFCHGCIKAALARSPTCPMCRAPLRESDLVPSKSVQARLDALQVYCLHYPACAWQGTRHALTTDHLPGDCPFVPVWCNEHQNHPDCPKYFPRHAIQEHRATCRYQMLSCPLGCLKKFYKKEALQLHQASECVHRLVECNRCQEPHRFCDIRQHEVVCPKFIISCPHRKLLGDYGGCTDTFERAQLVCHLEDCKYENAKDILLGLRAHTMALEQQLVGIEWTMAQELAILSTLTVEAGDVERGVDLRTLLRFNPAIRNLSARDFHPSLAWQNLTQLLQTNSTVVSLCLRHSEIEKTGAVLLAKALRANQTLHTILLPGNNIGDQGIEFLARALETNTSVHTLDVSNNNITDKGLAHLTRSLRGNETLTSLILADNRIKHKGLETFIDMLRLRMSPTLHFHRVSAIPVNEDDAAMWPVRSGLHSAEGFENQVIEPYSSVSSNIPLFNLIPSENLDSLSLQNVPPRVNETSPSSEHSSPRVTLGQRLYYRPRRRRRPCPFPEPLLTFETPSTTSSCDSSSTTAGRQLPDLRPLVLQCLDLSQNDLGPKGAECLATLVQAIGCPLVVLHLSSCKLGGKGVESLVQALEFNHHLRVLSLENNLMDDERVMTLQATMSTKRPNLQLRLCDVVGSQPIGTSSAEPATHSIYPGALSPLPFLSSPGDGPPRHIMTKTGTRPSHTPVRSNLSTPNPPSTHTPWKRWPHSPFSPAFTHQPVATTGLSSAHHRRPRLASDTSSRTSATSSSYTRRTPSRGVSPLTPMPAQRSECGLSSGTLDSDGSRYASTPESTIPSDRAWLIRDSFRANCSFDLNESDHLPLGESPTATTSRETPSPLTIPGSSQQSTAQLKPPFYPSSHPTQLPSHMSRSPVKGSTSRTISEDLPAVRSNRPLPSARISSIAN